MRFHGTRREFTGLPLASLPTVVVLVLLLLMGPAIKGQGGPGTANPVPTVWIPLPQAVELFAGDPDDEPGNWRIADVHVLDVTIGEQPTRARIYYTTEGKYVGNPAPAELHSGRLRPVDVNLPLPDLSSAFSGDGPWTAGEDVEWFIQPPVLNWNQYFGTPADPSGESNPPHGKRGSLVGMKSVNGFLFVTTASRSEPVPGLNFSQWNGLSMLDGTADPLDAFNPLGLDELGGPAPKAGSELWSAGFGGDTFTQDPVTDEGLRWAVPEGLDIIAIQPQGASLGRYAFVANYCGYHAGGSVLVQNISNLGAVNPASRYLIPMYELLGNSLDINPYHTAQNVAEYPELFPCPTQQPLPDDTPNGPLGKEVARNWFTCAIDSERHLPACDDLVEPFFDPGSVHQIAGNKIRPVIVVDVPSQVPFNGGRKLLIAGLNKDPFAYEDYESSGLTASHGDPLDTLSTNPDRDDGKYDFLGIIDISWMVTRIPPQPWPYGADYWRASDGCEWAERARFLRLPPDVPPSGTGWQLGDPVPAGLGYDFSDVVVAKPNDPGVEQTLRIVGSGTPKTITVGGPNDRYLYVVTSDQGHESVAENALLHDGGFHIPHLYVIDLGSVDVTNQNWLNTHSNGPNLRKYRFNKVMFAGWDTGGSPALDVFGATAVHSNIPGMPTSPTIVEDPGGPLTDPGPVYPGEYHLDPTARARVHAVHNPNMAAGNHPYRLYVGINGRAQTDPDNYDGGRIVGGVFVFGIESDGSPTYLRTLVIPQDLDVESFGVGGLEVVGPGAGLVPQNAAYNVVIVAATAFNQFEPPQGDVPAQDRLVFIQDPEL